MQKGVVPNKEIIAMRTQKLLGKELSVSEYFSYLHDFLTQHYDDIHKNILNGLGELVDQQQKTYLSNNFLGDVIGNLQFYAKEI